MPQTDDPSLHAQVGTAAMRKVYAEARRIAHAVLRRSGRDSTWSTTVLVNEAFMRLLGGDWEASVQTAPNTIIPLLRRVMETALVDHHRRRVSRKRAGGEGRKTVYYDDGMTAFDDDPANFLDILETIERLRSEQGLPITVSDPQKFAEALELGFILGCSTREIALQLDVPQTTVSRWIRYGKAYVNHSLQNSV